MFETQSLNLADFCYVYIFTVEMFVAIMGSILSSLTIKHEKMMTKNYGYDNTTKVLIAKSYFMRFLALKILQMANVF